MSSKFFDLSKKVADEFIQNILVVDDEIFTDEDGSTHNLNAKGIIEAFAASKKLCSLNSPNGQHDLSNVIEVARKTDILITDWRIFPEGESGGDSEDDIAEIDERGKFTIELLKGVIGDNKLTKGSLKLLIVFSGEVDLNEIARSIDSSFRQDGFVRKGNEIVKDKVKIIVIGKPGLKGTFKHTPEFEKWVVDYPDLPDFALSEFTKMTSGLLSNFVLKTVATLRNNTSELIGLFNQDLDSAYVLHKVLLPYPEDAHEQLIEMFSNSIDALLKYNYVGDIADKSSVLNWVEGQEFAKSIKVSNKEIGVDKDFIAECVQSGIEMAIKSKWPEGISQTQSEKVKKFSDNIYVKHPDLFSPSGGDSKNEEFSILTHHKSNMKRETINPILSLGSIVKDLKGNRYYLCIQARCDSVRIDSERRFLFVSLERVEDEKKFHFVINDSDQYIKLKVITDAFALRTIKFKPLDNDRVIKANSKEDGRFYFKSVWDNDEFQWIADLKDAHAQREANSFASRLSRVGLDESEWLRKWATKNS